MTQVAPRILSLRKQTIEGAGIVLTSGGKRKVSLLRRLHPEYVIDAIEVVK
jgi:hypothetical protein